MQQSLWILLQFSVAFGILPRILMTCGGLPANQLDPFIDHQALKRVAHGMEITEFLLGIYDDALLAQSEQFIAPPTADIASPNMMQF